MPVKLNSRTSEENSTQLLTLVWRKPINELVRRRLTMEKPCTTLATMRAFTFQCANAGVRKAITIVRTAAPTTIILGLHIWTSRAASIMNNSAPYVLPLRNGVSRCLKEAGKKNVTGRPDWEKVSATKFLEAQISKRGVPLSRGNVTLLLLEELFVASGAPGHTSEEADVVLATVVELSAVVVVVLTMLVIAKGMRPSKKEDANMSPIRTARYTYLAESWSRTRFYGSANCLYCFPSPGTDRPLPCLRHELAHLKITELTFGEEGGGGGTGSIPGRAAILMSTPSVLAKRHSVRHVKWNRVQLRMTAMSYRTLIVSVTTEHRLGKKQDLSTFGISTGRCAKSVPRVDGFGGILVWGLFTWDKMGLLVHVLRPSPANDIGTCWQITCTHFCTHSSLQEISAYSKTVHWTPPLPNRDRGEEIAIRLYHGLEVACLALEVTRPQSYRNHLGCCREGCAGRGSCFDQSPCIVGGGRGSVWLETASGTLWSPSHVASPPSSGRKGMLSKTKDEVDRSRWLRTTILRVPTLCCFSANTYSENGVTLPLVGGFSRGSPVPSDLSFRGCSILI
ncbi:hypothetical protein PR048_017216 [Dryococelus australis]|uniref:Uncharacterized protein n=1 Tax=Dryococelus australis TaxID=614101 RepID=A0ABQ9H938_9NEOP|nr:hypothetical protein PR048_017216 [Dryococelus australis]